MAKVCRDAKKIYSKIIPQSFEKQAKKFENEGIPKSYKIYIIQQDNKRIGFLGVKKLNDNIIYLVGLYLLSDYQKKGHGRKVIEKLISECEKKIYREIILLVHKDADWAINFYKKVNFEIETDNIKKIEEYAEGAMEKFYLPTTFLMKKTIQ